MKLIDIKMELDREAAVRRGAYPGWIAKGSIDQATADDRIAKMQRAADILAWLDGAGTERVKMALAVLVLAESKKKEFRELAGDDLLRIFDKYPQAQSVLRG